MYWEQSLETMGRRELERHQLRLVNASLARARRSPHYGQALARLPETGLARAILKAPESRSAKPAAASRSWPRMMIRANRW